jgi:alpha-1,6-mannosyltransferase
LALYAGRFSPEKRLDVLIDAWLEVERRRDASLVLIGTGPLEERLRARVRARNVIWRPFDRDRERLADLLAAVDLYISPGSTAEAFGLSSLEALASGTPVLAASPGAVPEQVQQTGAGTIFRAGDVEDLASAALRLFDSNLVALGLRGREYAEREHAWPTVFDRLFDLYRNELAR